MRIFGVVFVVACVVQMGGTQAGERITYNLGSSTIHVQEINSGTDCLDFAEVLAPVREKAYDAVSKCMLNSEPNYTPGVRICGRFTWTAYPNCIGLSDAACIAADYMRDKLRQCYSLAHKSIVESHRRAALALEERLLQLNNGQRNDVADATLAQARAMNTLRRKGSASERLSRRLTSLGLELTDTTARTALADLDRAHADSFGEYSARTPIPSASRLYLPPMLNEALTAADSVAAQELNLAFGALFGSDPEIADLLPLLAQHASSQPIDFESVITRDDIIELQQLMAAEEDSSGVDSSGYAKQSWDNADLERQMRNRLATLTPKTPLSKEIDQPATAQARQNNINNRAKNSCLPDGYESCSSAAERHARSNRLGRFGSRAEFIEWCDICNCSGGYVGFGTNRIYECRDRATSNIILR